MMKNDAKFKEKHEYDNLEKIKISKIDFVEKNKKITFYKKWDM